MKGHNRDEMVGWHHRFNGHEFEQAPGVGDGQGTTDWFQIGKEYIKAAYCHPASLTYMQSTL